MYLAQTSISSHIVTFLLVHPRRQAWPKADVDLSSRITIKKASVEIMDFTRSERIYLRLHPELNEKWVQELIASDPSILGLG
jgi:hypothetical protein